MTMIMLSLLDFLKYVLFYKADLMEQNLSPSIYTWLLFYKHLAWCYKITRAGIVSNLLLMLLLIK